MIEHIEKTKVLNLVAPFIEQIKSYSFKNFVNLKFAYIPNLNSVGAYGFSYCHSLTKIVANNITKIDSRAFEECLSLCFINLQNVEHFGTYSFYNSGVVKVTNTKCLKIHPSFIECECLQILDLEAKNFKSNHVHDCSSLGFLRLPQSKV